MDNNEDTTVWNTDPTPEDCADADGMVTVEVES